MFLISHRGNILGKNERENHPDYIKVALENFNVEVDVWLVDKHLVLGHDKPQYPVDNDFFTPRMWCHAKTPQTLEALLNLRLNCFYHNRDECTLTSNGYIWTYPDKPLTLKSIAVMPENTNYTIKEVFVCPGVCSDFILNFRT